MMIMMLAPLMQLHPSILFSFSGRLLACVSSPQVVVDSDVERLMLMKQEQEILERQSRRAGGVPVRAMRCF